MAVFIVDCPHCGAGAMAFHIFGVRPSDIAAFHKPGPSTLFAAGVCGVCDLPVAAQLSHPRGGSEQYPVYLQTAQSLTQTNTTLQTLDYHYVDSWPKPAEVSIPAELPSQVERAFRQAERNYLLPDCEEASATMYRRALDVGIKSAYPDVSGTLDAKIKKLVADHELPESLGNWAHEVRLIGNDGAHDIEGVNKADLDDARAFIDTVLRYIFTLPAQIKARKSATVPEEAAS